MELTKRERTLLEQARSNPHSREPMAKVLLGFCVAVLAVVCIGAWFGGTGWSDVSRASLFVCVGALVYQQAAAQAVAWSLIAKLDGSFADRVPSSPTALGLGPASR